MFVFAIMLIQLGVVFSSALNAMQTNLMLMDCNMQTNLMLMDCNYTKVYC